MSISGFIPNPETAETVVAWVKALAEKDEETVFLCFEAGLDGRSAQAVRALLDKIHDWDATLIAIDDPMPVQAVLSHLRWKNIRLLVTSPFELPAVSGSDQTADELMRSAPCQVFLPLYGEKAPPEVKKILVVLTGRDHDHAAVRLVNTLRLQEEAQVTVGAVEDKTGAAAGQEGKSWIRGILHDEALDPELFQIKVVVDRLKHRGITEFFEDHDLVVIGADAANRVHLLRQSLGDATVALVKRIPLSRFRALTDWLPRINPTDHGDLLYDLRRGSVWGPDFIGMLGLASAIASLGLLQDSPAVVIGSMLLAPLMTPMIGVGLALGQANTKLIRLCGKSIGLGFLLTLAVSYLIGIITPAGETLPNEVLARGGPNVLDLLIAVFAAAAATFAMARPNIYGAIAGVAIATALVPPVCSVGISLALGELLNALGAMVLFVTNLLAIIVTSSFTFSLLGITASRALARHRRRAEWGRWAIVVLLLALAGPLSTALMAQLEAGKHVPAAYPVTQEVFRAVRERLDQDKDVTLTLIARPRTERKVTIQIASREQLPRSYANELRQIVREKMDDPELAVTVVAVRGLWRSDSDSLPDESP